MTTCNTCNATMDLIMEGDGEDFYDWLEDVYWCPHCGTLRTARTDGYAEEKVQYQTPSTLSEALKSPGSNPNHQESNDYGYNMHALREQRISEHRTSARRGSGVGRV